MNKARATDVDEDVSAIAGAKSTDAPSTVSVGKIALILAIIPSTFAAIIGVLGLGHGILFKQSFIDRPVLYMLQVLWFFAIPVGIASLWTVICASDKHLKSRSLHLVVILSLGLSVVFGTCLYLEIWRWSVTNSAPVPWKIDTWPFTLVPMGACVIQLRRLWKLSHESV
jgi:hypothetical protein